jgi:hypothetical protein
MAEIWRDSGAHTDTGEVADRRTRFLEEHVTVTDLARRYELPSEVQLALRDLECPAAEHDNLIVSRLCGVFITASYAPS